MSSTREPTLRNAKAVAKVKMEREAETYKSSTVVVASSSSAMPVLNPSASYFVPLETAMTAMPQGGNAFAPFTCGTSSSEPMTIAVQMPIEDKDGKTIGYQTVNVPLQLNGNAGQPQHIVMQQSAAAPTSNAASVTMQSNGMQSSSLQPIQLVQQPGGQCQQSYFVACPPPTTSVDSKPSRNTDSKASSFITLQNATSSSNKEQSTITMMPSGDCVLVNREAGGTNELISGQQIILNTTPAGGVPSSQSSTTATLSIPLAQATGSQSTVYTSTGQQSYQFVPLPFDNANQVIGNFLTGDSSAPTQPIMFTQQSGSATKKTSVKTPRRNHGRSPAKRVPTTAQKIIKIKKMSGDGTEGESRKPLKNLSMGDLGDWKVVDASAAVTGVDGVSAAVSGNSEKTTATVKINMQQLLAQNHGRQMVLIPKIMPDGTVHLEQATDVRIVDEDEEHRPMVGRSRQSHPSHPAHSVNVLYNGKTHKVELPEKRAACNCQHCIENQGLSVESRRHSNHLCHICGKTYGKTSHLRAHLRNHAGAKPFTCGECDKSFTRTDELQRHEKTHVNHRPYNCVVCSKSFLRRDHVRKHMRTHPEYKGEILPPPSRRQSAMVTQRVLTEQRPVTMTVVGMESMDHQTTTVESDDDEVMPARRIRM